MWTDRHPTDNELFEYHFECLSGAALSEIEEHILGCPSCVDVLEKIQREHLSLNALEQFVLHGPMSPEGLGVELHLRTCNPCRRSEERVRSDIRDIVSSFLP